MRLWLAKNFEQTIRRLYCYESYRHSISLQIILNLCSICLQLQLNLRRNLQVLLLALQKQKIIKWTTFLSVILIFKQDHVLHQGQNMGRYTTYLKNSTILRPSKWIVAQSSVKLSFSLRPCYQFDR